MNFKTTLFLLVMVLLVGAYFHFVDNKVPVPGPDEIHINDQAGTPVLDKTQWSTEKIDSIQVESAGKKYRIKLDGSDWSQVEPVHCPLNNWEVQRVIDAAINLRWYSKVNPSTGKDQPTLQAMGLDKPGAVVTIIHDGPDKLTKVIRLGQVTGLGGNAYAMIDDDPTPLLVNDPLHKAVLDSKIQDWRKKNLPDVPAEGQTTRITLTQSGSAASTIDLTKTDGKWFLPSSHNDRADTGSIAELLSALHGVYLSKYVEDNPANLADYGLDKPTLTLAIESVATVPPPLTTQPSSQPAPVKTERRTLSIGAPTDLSGESYFALYGKEGSAERLVVTITKMDQVKFAKNVDSFRDPRITVLSTNDVSGVKVSAHAAASGDAVQNFEIKRGPKNWELAPGGAGGTFPLENALVEKLVSALAGARADSYEADTTTVNTNYPTYTFVLTGSGHPDPETLTVFDADDSKHWKIYRNRESRGYLVSKDSLLPALVPAKLLRSLTLLETQPEDVEKVTITRTLPRAMENVSYSFTHPAATTQGATAGWNLEGQNVFEAASFDQAISSFLPIKAEQWSSPETATTGPAAELAVVIQTHGGKTTTIHINPTTRKISIDGLNFDGAEPQLSEKTIKGLMQEFRNRTLIQLGNAQISKVTTTIDGQSSTLSRDANNLFIESSGKKVDQVAAAKIFDTLAGLRVEHFLDLPKGAATPARTIQIESKTGNKLTLEFPGADGLPGNTGRLGDKAFVLLPSTFKKITADIFKTISNTPPAGEENPEAGEEQRVQQ